MESNDTPFGFGSKPCMKEVPAGEYAVFSFRGDGVKVETDYGEKYSFPITLISHPSYDTLPLNMDWQSKCISAKQVYIQLFNGNNTIKGNEGFEKKLRKAYNDNNWRLTRFDTGAYWLEAVL